jgi:hypothetical protein
MAKQQRCAAIVKANMSATARNKPAVMKTVMGYLFEYSPSRDTCVEVVHYRVQESGKPHQVQVMPITPSRSSPWKATKTVAREGRQGTRDADSPQSRPLP